MPHKCRQKVLEQEFVIKKYVPALIAVISLILAMAGCGSPAKGHTSTALSSQRTDSRPNFVFVLTDDLAWNLVSRMPRVRALENAGSTMSQYYVVDSLCCPSRAAIFTGQYPHDDGVFTNAGSDGGYNAYDRNGDPPKSFAVALQESGYRTAMMGKYLNGYMPADKIPPGWDKWDVTGNGYPEFNYNLNENGTIQYFGFNAKSYLTDVLSTKAGSFIDSSAASGRPFMLEVATFAPHTPYTPAPRYQNAAAGVPYPKTAAWNRLPKNPPAWLAGRPPLTPRQKNLITTTYRKRVEDDLAVDDLIGNLEARLRADGVAKNTYFIFSSDNGYHMGEYRLMPGKQTAFDTDTHVPLILTGPGVPAGRVISQLASNIDLNPTFETLAGLTVPPAVDGHSLADLWHGQQPANWRRSILIEHHGPDDARGDPDRQAKASADPPSYEAVRTANFLYVLSSNGQQEYYDTARDPLELDNIARQGIPSSIKKALAALRNCHTGASCWAAAHLH
jgi:N-acetylglucosamine-6-sulfatase